VIHPHPCHHLFPSRFFSSTRHRKVAPPPSYYRLSQKETCKETCCRFCHGQHGNGRFKHRRYVFLSTSVKTLPGFLRHQRPLRDRLSDSVASYSAGMTIHSWGAVTPGQNDLDKQIRCIRTCKPALNRWRTTKVLVIDEGDKLNS
jgi:hypothetical protein